MSRISYSEDEEQPGQFALWRSNTWRSVQGAAGQASLRQLLAALEAMPQRRLVSQALATDDGNVCAVGALVVTRVTETDGLPWAEAAAAVVEQYTPALCNNHGGDDYAVFCEHPERDHVDGRCRSCHDRDGQWAAGALHDGARRWRVCTSFVLAEPWMNEYDDHTTEAAGMEVAGMPRMVAWRLVELNDMDLEHATPEERWTKVHAWVTAALVPGAIDPSGPYGY